MSRIEALDIEKAPLTGTTLIEANAGTGKTWTITALYTRLLLEAGRTVEQILVVTFTEAATAELRDRIRSRLAQTRAAIHGGNLERDALAAGLLRRASDPARMLLQLESALRNFDQAPIYTIHGFCRRVLADSAFESAMPFASDLVPDQSEFLREIVDDFWRGVVNDASLLFARFLAERHPCPESLRDALERHLARPYVELRGPDKVGDAAPLERAYAAAHAGAREIWLESREEIRSQLADSGVLSGNRYHRDRVLQWLGQMHALLVPASPGMALFERFDRFTPGELTDGTKKGCRTPRHRFYDACQRLRDAHTALAAAYESRLARVKMDLVEYCNRELRARKKARQLRSYDDLLLDLHDALAGERGAELVRDLRKRYSAALIDEFQDTDPVQYAIFERIYGGSGLPVFFVGDPKQSIYSFRGADIFAYINARGAAQAAHTLETNWRSAPPLLKAVNCVFSRTKTPFVFNEIAFPPSQPARGDRGEFIVSGETAAPFELWFTARDDGKPITKSAANPAAAEATASEIARLMKLGQRGRARIVEVTPAGRRERPLQGGDIAVLVPTHRQGGYVREALSRLGVPSVQRGAESVFGSVEAAELERVLLAIAEPSREPLICGALCTEMMGVTGEALFAYRSDEAEWERRVETFREAHREWHEHGFMRMLQAFFKQHDVICRLLAYTDGERRVTNLLHLAERLHCESGTRGVGGLIAWLAAKRQSPGSADEEELLRLESDENLVKILTVHVAKGLEFPLVFCPFLWDGGLRSAKSDPVAFHDTNDGCGAVLDFGSADRDAARSQAMLEERAEDVRLAYVALTRARYRCWMVWGHINDAETSAPAWLLHPGQQKLAADTMRRDLDALVAASDGTICVRDLKTPADVDFTPASRDVTRLAARSFERILRDSKRVTSFTGLAHDRPIEAPDYDAADRPAEPDMPVSGRDIFAFPRGAHAGKCLHAIFEHVDFANCPRRLLEQIVTRDLAAHGFDTQWTRAVSDMVQAVLATPLEDDGALRLANVTRSQRLDELEFYYPICELSDRAIREVLLAWGFPDEVRQRIGSLAFSPVQGYMRGFIDLVFEQGGRYYLADYKSNWLGATVEAYGEPQLVKAMAREAYYLQYLVYCVALHRYLGTRLAGYRYDSHFGGVHYLFLRGMRPEHGSRYGVYSDRPAEDLIEALDHYLRSGSRKSARKSGPPRQPVQGAFDF